MNTRLSVAQRLDDTEDALPVVVAVWYNVWKTMSVSLKQFCFVTGSTSDGSAKVISTH